MKVMTVVGTRPEIIRLSRVIALLDRWCEHVLQESHIAPAPSLSCGPPRGQTECRAHRAVFGLFFLETYPLG